MRTENKGHFASNGHTSKNSETIKELKLAQSDRVTRLRADTGVMCVRCRRLDRPGNSSLHSD